MQKKIDAQLSQLYPEAKKSPKVQEALARIESLSETLTSIAGETRAEIVGLYAETVTDKHLSACAGKIAILETYQQQRVASILGASNDAKFSKAA